MRGTTRTVAMLAGITSVALLAAACGGGNSSDDPSSSAAGKTGGAVTVRGCNPQNPLVPGNTNETCGGNVLDAISAKLVHYNPETAAPENDIADKIETTDNQNFTVTLKKGYMFQDGTEVKAKNFVDAWNWVAAGENAALGSYFFDPIEGYADTQCTGDGDDPCAGAGKAKTNKLTGLAVKDDYTFTIKTTAKVSNLPVRLGYTAFAPVPDSFFADPKAFGEKPIGAGPFKFDSWTKNTEIKLSKFADYKGKFGGKLDNITFKIYQDDDAAYNDVIANQLDVIDTIPSSALIDDKYKTDLPDRNLSKAVGVIQAINFPPAKTDPNYSDVKVRQAISMAIDRPTIVKQIFNGTREPATGWVSPVVDGYKADACGESCVFDAAKAKAKLDEAGGFKGGKMTISYNADASHKAWVEATCNSIKTALGVDCVATPVVDFATFRAQITDRKMKGMFRAGWQMDYPSIENFLAPIYGTGAGSNDSDYSSAQFDQLLKEGAAAKDGAAANEKYQEAEKVLASDMASIPMWYSTAQFGWSNKVTGVKVTAFGTIDFSSLALK
ncbi:oligopeptide transport system substrate-binding protein [Pedococcus dokdonensis]|uniref:Oligopeptide transport system substrate-binding protein n=1 Tax=Pedococcus dokdonensis TaxID=443156 RepID=A0A1H0L6Q4_9MICO|nr:ABC transporter substrate-binding protein [Pedococcus dokdonensis]SDO63640.1 oligopeptide transport system substrate-binding protein [Pedococcus dokdonensis]